MTYLLRSLSVPPLRPTSVCSAASGARLTALHHEFDPRRFIAPTPGTPAAYASFLGSQIGRPETVLLVAASKDSLAGYVWGGVRARTTCLSAGRQGSCTTCSWILPGDGKVSEGCLCALGCPCLSRWMLNEWFSLPRIETKLHRRCSLPWGSGRRWSK